jgi:hypothetical protein
VEVEERLLDSASFCCSLGEEMADILLFLESVVVNTRVTLLRVIGIRVFVGEAF